MTQYTTGTVSISAGQVTGSGTTFTAAMVGKLFSVRDSGVYSLVASYISPTRINLADTGINASAGSQYQIWLSQFPNGMMIVSKNDADPSDPINYNNQRALTTDSVASSTVAGPVKVTASPTDTTAGRVTKVGDGGLLESSPSFLASGADSATLPRGTFWFQASAFASPPFGGNFSVVDVYPISTTAALQVARQVTSDLTFGRTRYRKITTTQIGEWSENYHEGNLNVNEFGGSANGLIGEGTAVTSSYAPIRLRVLGFTKPTSITMTGTFRLISLERNTTIETLNPSSIVLSSSESSMNCAQLNIATSVSMVVGERVYLRAETASSKITVNF